MNSRIAQLIMLVGRYSPQGVSLLGSAFAVTGKKFATAAHVTQQRDNGLVLIVNKYNIFTDYQDTTDVEVRTFNVKIHRYDPIRDIAILRSDEDVINLLPYKLVSTDIVKAGDRVISLGYPHADHSRMVLTQQTSTVGAKILLNSKVIKTKHIVMNIQTRPGQSGSPVFVGDEEKICAMVLGSYAPGGASGMSLGGIDPHTLHQTTHAISAEYIGRML